MGNTRKLKYDHPYPEGHASVCRYIEVAGEHAYRENLAAFGKLNNHRLEMVADPSNPHDRNAVKVFGVGEDGGLLGIGLMSSSKRYLLGFLPREVAAWIATHNVSLNDLSIGIYQIDWWQGEDSSDRRVFVRFNLSMPQAIRPNHDLYGFRN